MEYGEGLYDQDDQDGQDKGKMTRMKKKGEKICREPPSRDRARQEEPPLRAPAHEQGA